MLANCISRLFKGISVGMVNISSEWTGILDHFFDVSSRRSSPFEFGLLCFVVERQLDRRRVFASDDFTDIHYYQKVPENCFLRLPKRSAP